MKLIGEDEIEDFESTIKSHGRNREDYELIEKPDPIPELTIVSWTGRVTVKNKKSGATKTYRAGHGSAWVIDFEKDIEAGSI